MRSYVMAHPSRCTCDHHLWADVSGPCQYPHVEPVVEEDDLEE